MSNGAPQHLQPIVMGPPAHGSPNPATVSLTLTTPEDMPEMAKIEDVAAVGAQVMGVGAQAAQQTGLAAMSQQELYDIAMTYNITDADGNEVTEDMTKEELLAVIDPALEDLLKADLVTIAESAGMEVPSNATKADVINMLRGRPTAAQQQESLQPQIGTPPDTASTHPEAPEAEEETS